MPNAEVAARDPFDEVDDFFRPYRDAFQSADMAAIDALFEYPYVISNADGIREVKDSAVYKSQRAKIETNDWLDTRFDRFRKFRMGKGGALVLVDYARVKADGSVFHTGSFAYMLRHGPDGWKMVGILDEFGKGD